jgi:hypothetical protein
MKSFRRVVGEEKGENTRDRLGGGVWERKKREWEM